MSSPGTFLFRSTFTIDVLFLAISSSLSSLDNSWKRAVRTRMNGNLFRAHNFSMHSVSITFRESKSQKKLLAASSTVFPRFRSDRIGHCIEVYVAKVMANGGRKMEVGLKRHFELGIHFWSCFIRLVRCTIIIVPLPFHTMWCSIAVHVILDFLGILASQLESSSTCVGLNITTNLIGK